MSLEQVLKVTERFKRENPPLPGAGAEGRVGVHLPEKRGKLGVPLEDVFHQ